MRPIPGQIAYKWSSQQLLPNELDSCALCVLPEEDFPTVFGVCRWTCKGTCTPLPVLSAPFQLLGQLRSHRYYSLGFQDVVSIHHMHWAHIASFCAHVLRPKF